MILLIILWQNFECQCDIWCKPGQYLDYKNCVYKHKFIGRIIEECTNVINETMINNKDNIDNDNTITNIFIVLFSIVMFILIVCSCIFIYFKWFKNKKKILTTLRIKMVIKSLKIKNQSYYYWYDIIFIDDFNTKLFKIAKRESRAGIGIYYIGYVVNKLEYDISSVKPLYLSVKSLLGKCRKNRWIK